MVSMYPTGDAICTINFETKLYTVSRYVDTDLIRDYNDYDNKNDDDGWDPAEDYEEIDNKTFKTINAAFKFFYDIINDTTDLYHGYDSEKLDDFITYAITLYEK